MNENEPPDPEGAAPPWLHLLDHMNRGWREKQILKGRNPDPYIERQLREAGVWPPSSTDPEQP